MSKDGSLFYEFNIRNFILYHLFLFKISCTKHSFIEFGVSDYYVIYSTIEGLHKIKKGGTIMDILKMFDIIEVKFPYELGSVQGKTRPCVIVQNDIGNKYSPTVIVIPLTSEIKKLNMPTHCILKKNQSNGLYYDSMLLGEQLRVIDKSIIVGKIGHAKESYEQDNIINVYLANITGKKRYIPVWEKIIYAFYKIIRETNIEYERGIA